ncbi:MAG: alanine racemase [Deltaproteobacteria bacterium]|nr:MAG: alanine racemase [Deltaproteobacteria bacterium]
MVGSTIEIDLEALRHNFAQVRNLVGQSSSILAVVKSDAYGHGMVEVARELEVQGVEYLGVSTSSEGITLRKNGLKTPILILLGVEKDEFSEIIQHRLTPVLYRSDIASEISSAALAAKTQLPVHLKIDTGMGRLGVPYVEAAKFFELIRSLEGIRVEGLLSHFASADEHDKSFSSLQLERFRQVLTQAESAGLDFRYTHIANSAGVIDLPDSYLQLVRSGLMLYGAPPSQELHRPVSLKPVMTLKTRVLQVKEVDAGSPIGYGCTYVTTRPSRIATLPIGYDDGYDRLLSNKGVVLVRNCRAPVVGRISMCLTTVDVTEVPDVQVDDEVVLLGRQGDQEITADEIAALIGTINYEIFCNLGGNRKKQFLNSPVK